MTYPPSLTPDQAEAVRRRYNMAGVTIQFSDRTRWRLDLALLAGWYAATLAGQDAATTGRDPGLCFTERLRHSSPNTILAWVRATLSWLDVEALAHPVAPTPTDYNVEWGQRGLYWHPAITVAYRLPGPVALVDLPGEGAEQQIHYIRYGTDQQTYADLILDTPTGAWYGWTCYCATGPHARYVLDPTGQLYPVPGPRCPAFEEAVELPIQTECAPDPGPPVHRIALPLSGAVAP